MPTVDFFKEKAKMPQFLLVLFILEFFLVLILGNLDKYEMIYLTLFNVFFCGIIFFSSFSLQLNKFGVSYSFLLIRNKIPWYDIKYIELKNTLMGDFPLGYGVRYSRKLGWAYVFGSDTALYIELKNQKKYVLNVKNKEHLICFIKENGLTEFFINI